MKTHKTMLFLFVVLSFLFVSNNNVFSENEIERDIFSYIDKLEFNKVIDIDQAELYKIYALVRPDKLPDFLKDVVSEGDQPVAHTGDRIGTNSFFCGTSIIEEVYRKADSLSPKTIAEINSLILPKMADSDVIIDSQKLPIRIHCPEFIGEDIAYEVLQYAERAWEVEVNQYGFYPPPPDGTFGGNDYYDIFIRDLRDSGAGGYMARIMLDYTHDWFCMTTCCVISIEVKFGLDFVTYHEFNHSCQFAMDAADAQMIYEATATYIGDTVKNGFFSGKYRVDSFQVSPNYSLDSTGDGWRPYIYGACLFLGFLSEYYDNGDPIFVRKIWDGLKQKGEINEPDFMDSIENLIFEYKGDSFNDMYREFARWRYFTGENDDGHHFKNGSKICQVLTKTIFTKSDLPLINFNSENPPAEYGANYMEFDLKDIGASLFLNFSGEKDKLWSLDVILVPENKSNTEIREFTMTDNSSGSIYIHDTWAFEKAALVISNLSDGDHDPDNEDWAFSNYTLNAEIVYGQKASVYTDKSAYNIGDSLDARLCIVNPREKIDMDVVVALYANGNFFFYPDWRSDPYKTRMMLDSKAVKEINVLSLGSIPDGFSGDFCIYSILLNPESGEIIGARNRTDFRINQ
jgi:hypothetical protein